MHASGGSIVLVEVHGEDYVPLTGDGEVTMLGVTNLSLDIQGKPYVWNFIVYGIIGFDVLLGMDWLSAH